MVPGSVLSRIAELKDGGARMPGTTCETLEHLSYLDGIASEVLAALTSHPDEEVRWWAAAAKRQIETHVQDFKTFTAWESTGNPPDTIRDEVPQDLVPYLSLFCTKVETLNNQIPSLQGCRWHTAGSSYPDWSPAGMAGHYPGIQTVSPVRVING